MRLTAAASATWPRCVLARPIERERRKPSVRTPCEWVPESACPMAIDLLILLCLLTLACRNQRLHPLLWMQGHCSPLRSCTQRLTGADFAITDAENFTLISTLPAS